MERIRSVVGLVMGVLLVASACAHSLLGWPELQAELAEARVPAELAGALMVGWQFGGAAMLTFGIVVLATFWARLRKRQASLLVGMYVGLLYVSFGVWALVVTGMNPFFLVFIIPGCGLVLASWPTNRAE